MSEHLEDLWLEEIGRRWPAVTVHNLQTNADRYYVPTDDELGVHHGGLRRVRRVTQLQSAAFPDEIEVEAVFASGATELQRYIARDG